MQYYEHLKNKGGVIISYVEIAILPYEGQHEPKELVVPKEETVMVKKELATASVGSIHAKPERKTLTQLTGKLASTNIGIKSTLAPPKKNGDEDTDIGLVELNDEYTFEQLQHAWKEYALNVKRANRDSLYATLTNSDMSVSSDHMITLKIQNSVQSNELDIRKAELVQFLRSKLRNTNINLRYDMEEKKSVTIMDSKAKFDKLAEENSSLHKFRKLFNLDIEY